jgi:hypothetical protein
MTARVVRATEINRVLDVLAARGEKPAAYTVLPGGAIRLHMVEPANDAVPVESEAEQRAWAEALGG